MTKPDFFISMSFANRHHPAYFLAYSTMDIICFHQRTHPRLFFCIIVPGYYQLSFIGKHHPILHIFLNCIIVTKVPVSYMKGSYTKTYV